MNKTQHKDHMSLYPGYIAQTRPPLEKTRLCQYHLLNRCRYGSSCSFAHSPLELRVAPANVRKTKLCPLFSSGLCFDSFCNYAHGLEEMRSSSQSIISDLCSTQCSPSSDQEYVLLLNMLNLVLTEKQCPDSVSLLDQVSHY